jgi:hypothetical protein
MFLRFYWSKILGIEGACKKGGKSIFTASYNLVTLRGVQTKRAVLRRMAQRGWF